MVSFVSWSSPHHSRHEQGKKYWSQSAWDQGVRDAGGLRFAQSSGASKDSISEGEADSKEPPTTKSAPKEKEKDNEENTGEGT